MKTARLRTPALSALAVLLISGAGIAFAGSKPPAPAAVAPAAAPAVAPAAVPAATPLTPPAVEPTPVGPDADTLIEGDQTTPDAAGAAPESAGAPEAAETPEVAGAPETTGVEELGDANLPGGGHADDPNDPNADHQFDGVE